MLNGTGRGQRYFGDFWDSVLQKRNTLGRTLIKKNLYIRAAYLKAYWVRQYSHNWKGPPGLFSRLLCPSPCPVWPQVTGHMNLAEEKQQLHNTPSEFLFCHRFIWKYYTNWTYFQYHPCTDFYVSQSRILFCLIFKLAPAEVPLGNSPMKKAAAKSKPQRAQAMRSVTESLGGWASIWIQALTRNFLISLLFSVIICSSNW